LRKKSKIILSILFTSLAGCSQTRQCTPVNSEMTVSDVYKIAVERGFTGSVLVRHKGNVMLNEAAGFANRELETPHLTDTISSTGSITKQFTAALILSLEEAGILSVDDKLTKYFDDVPKDKVDITIHQLLTHTAGLPRSLVADDEPISRADLTLDTAWQPLWSK